MQTAVVTGGAGFIGSHLCQALINKGYKVICIDNLITGNKENISDLTASSHFEFIEQDVTTSIHNISGIDYLFHLASPASPNKKSKKSYMNLPIETLLVNSLGTYQLLELAKAKSARFLYASSSEVYGDPEVSPQSEDYFGNVNPNGIRSVYDEGKRFGEAITMAYVRKFNLDARIVRIFNTYGPKMQKDDGRVVSNFINQAIQNDPLTVYGDGTQTRSFCYVSDMVDGLQKAMFTQNSKGEVFNLGNPDERTITELATIIKNMLSSSSEIVHEEALEDDPKRRKPNIDKAKDKLHWEPKIKLEDGLKEAIQYFKSA